MSILVRALAAATRRAASALADHPQGETAASGRFGARRRDMEIDMLGDGRPNLWGPIVAKFILGLSLAVTVFMAFYGLLLLLARWLDKR